MTASSFTQKGVGAASQGNLTEAELCFRQAFLLAKKETGKFNIGAANLIRLLHQQNKNQEVVTIAEELGTEQMLKLPQICILMAAESALKTGENRVSASLYNSLHALYPQEKMVVLGFSQALILIGDLDKADKILQSYAHINEPDAEITSNLAMIALEKGNLIHAEAHYRKASRLAPKTFVVHYNLGKYLQMHGDLDEALTEFDTCLEIVPSAVEAMIAKAETLRSKGLEKESRELYIKAMEKNGLNKEQMIAIVKPILAVAIEQADMKTCRKYLGRISNEIRSDFRLKTIIYDLSEELQNEFGDGADLYDPNKLVVSNNFIANLGYLEKIKEQVLSHKSLIRDRPGKPTRGGKQSHEIMETSNNELKLLKRELEDELINYANNMPASIRPPANSTFRISGWAVSLESGGHQLRHSHPEAIASGVLYLSIPTDMNLNDDDKDGSLYFSGGVGKPEEQSMYVKATMGKLVMFPSYMPHETIPFKSTQDRVCLAVNLIKVK
ncbi:MAG: putative 2OG-Fe(II) oxygenase [Cyanobacteria bacterium]|nr:putative 2OG-Fe(II) oxygenase [Cyanobacteriota bacterium]